jgi:predicted heme/steroid binding protein
MGITAIPYTAVLAVPSNRLLGNDNGTTGPAEALTAADVRTLLSVYTTTEVDTLLAGKAASVHTHAVSDITGLSTTLAAKADLVGGLVPAAQLPSYVDDVLEYANLAAFPATGEAGKIYVALDTNRTYRWGGSTYAELTDSTAVWGSISGTLSNQTDLVSALSGKSDTGHTHAYSSLTGIPSTFSPSAHKTSHATGGTDALSPSDIGAVPTSRQLTINGTAYDLSTDRSWTVSGGISTLNTLTDATQTFAVGTTGTDFAIVSAAGVHTFNLPSASATARGVVTTGTQTFGGIKTFDSGDVNGGPVSGGTWRLDLSSSQFNVRTSFSRIAFVNAGGNVATIRNTDPVLEVTGNVRFGGFGSTFDLFGDSANVAALRSGTNAQGFRIYNTYTSATSHERLNIAWASNICTIETEKGSAGGTLRGLRIGGSSSALVGLWGATPIVQPTTAVASATRVSGGGTALTDTDTYDGYTLAQIVKALRNIGALA